VVDKKVFDALLVEFMDKSPGLHYVLLNDLEGFAVSFIAKSVEDRKNPKTVAAVTRTLLLPAYHYQSGLSLSSPLLGVFMFNEQILLELNVGYGLLSLFFDKNEWPISTTNFESFLRKLFNHVPNLKSSRKSLLSSLYKDDGSSGISNFDVEQFIPTVINCLEKMSSGVFSPLSLSVTATDLPTLCATIGQGVGTSALGTSIVLAGTQACFQMGNNAELFGKIAQNALDVHLIDPVKLKMSLPLFEVYCYLNGELIISAPIGKVEGKILELSMYFPSWSVGLNEAAGGLYGAAVSCHELIGSEESVNFINLMNYLMSSVSDLRELIEQALNEGRRDDARVLMKRSTKLLQNAQEYSVAGDYFKWIAYTYFEVKDFSPALENYKLAAQNYLKANDFENLATTYLDIASLGETMNEYGESLEHYEKAIQVYNQLGSYDNVRTIEQKLNEIRTVFEKNVIDFIGSNTGDSISLDLMSSTLHLPVNSLINLLQNLINAGTIPGQVHAGKGQYTRKVISRVMGGNASVTTASISSTSAGGSGLNLASGSLAAPSVEVQFVDYSQSAEITKKLNDEILQLNSELNATEQKFQTKGINFMDILKYQARLEKKKLNELKMRIHREMPMINREDGIPETCVCCLERIGDSESVGVCPNGHGFHVKCLSSWLKSQDRCPVCDGRLLPFVLRDYRESLGGTGGGLNAKESDELQNLRVQNEMLRQGLGDSSELFDKLVAEKEDKNRLLNDLRKKDQMINELRSQIKVLRR
jgi:tetratricopeptide (TPR) repeat protein